ncbi:MAG: septum formation initiator family protein [Proteobacteria bacterium]|nr:septum formation initiator family protein [Pseudomonadota bacterium]
MFTRIRPFAPTALLAFLVFYFGLHALTGERGVLAQSERVATLASKTAELNRIRAVRKDLEARAYLLRDEHISADLLEERARTLLGFSDPRDYVVRVG